VPNVLLSYGTPAEVRGHCRKIIDEVARDGGYIMDASAIMQNDTDPDNLRALTEVTREYGVYSAGNTGGAELLRPSDGSDTSNLNGLANWPATRVAPGACVPWSEKAAELPELFGDRELLERIWKNIDSLGNTFIWQCLLSF
jgi:hypothetical protein